MTADQPSVTLLLQTPDGHLRAIPSRRTHIQHRINQARAAHHQTLTLAAVLTTPRDDLDQAHHVRDDWYRHTLLNTLPTEDIDHFTTQELQTTDARAIAAQAASALAGAPDDATRAAAADLALKLTQTGDPA